MLTRRMALALLACALAVGCKGSSKESLQDATAFCRELAATWADRAADCTPVDRSFVEFQVRFMLDCAALAKAQAEGTFTYDKAEAQACLDAFAAEPCAVVRDADGPPERCKDAVAAAVLPGGDCWSGAVDLECIGGYCEMNLAACNAPGTCVAWLGEAASCSTGGRCGPGLVCDGVSCVVETPVTVVGAGQPCAAPGTACDVGLFCDGSQVTPVCMEPRTSGSCFDKYECAVGFDCRCVDAGCVEQHCIPVKGLGAVCAQGVGECVDGLWCGTGNACVRLPAVGEACGELANGEFAICMDGWCEPAPLMGRLAPAVITSGTCRAFKALGATCDTTAGQFAWMQCGPGATCQDGTCVVSWCGAIGGT